jgi:hypothetical protein
MSSALGRFDRRRFLYAVGGLMVAAALQPPLATLTRVPIGTVHGATPPAILIAGTGSIGTEAILVRGCSALTTGLAGIGGSLPIGLALDFGRSLALIVGGIDRESIDVRPGDALIAAPAGNDWAVVAIDRDAARRSWRARIGETLRPIDRETTAG